MSVLRLGTRGSALALAQTQIVMNLLRRAHPSLLMEVVVIESHADRHPEQPIDEDWPAGAFTSALEDALTDDHVDVAVHSYKDLPSRRREGLRIAAVPPREFPADVLITAMPVTLDALPMGLRVGTSSARRAAQLAQLGDVQVVPIRGNVPSRLSKVGDADAGIDAVVLAAAGLNRLRLQPLHSMVLPLERFPTAPAQGAIAVETRIDGWVAPLLQTINDVAASRAVAAERAVLFHLDAGCRTPLGATAYVDHEVVRLHAQLFSADGKRVATVMMEGGHPLDLGREVATALVSRLEETE